MKKFGLDYYIIEGSSEVENLPLVNIEWTFTPFLFPWWHP